MPKLHDGTRVAGWTLSGVGEFPRRPFNDFADFVAISDTEPGGIPRICWGATTKLSNLTPYVDVERFKKILYIATSFGARIARNPCTA